VQSARCRCERGLGPGRFPLLEFCLAQAHLNMLRSRIHDQLIINVFAFYDRHSINTPPVGCPKLPERANAEGHQQSQRCRVPHDTIMLLTTFLEVARMKHQGHRKWAHGLCECTTYFCFACEMKTGLWCPSPVREMLSWVQTLNAPQVRRDSERNTSKTGSDAATAVTFHTLLSWQPQPQRAKMLKA
jgi:hypothetical protein